MGFKSISSKMNSLAKQILTEQNKEPSCVHKNLTLRSLVMLKYINSDSEEIFTPMAKALIAFSKRPDRKGDYEKGPGRHYYCAVNTAMKKNNPINGYFRNGKGKCYKSARAMFEEDYTMALTMYVAGFQQKSAEFLGRAIHMISDMCCIPHVSGMTYFSNAAVFHKSYENLAEAVYPELVPRQTAVELPDYFDKKYQLGESINRLALDTAKGIKDMSNDPVKAITAHLQRAERVVTALLIRFMEDITSLEKDAHFITNNSGCRIMRGTAPLTVKVSEKGIHLHGVNPSPESRLNVTERTFYAAHRHDGLYTLSPARDKEGRVLEVSAGKLVLRKFDPVHCEQLFKLS